MILSGDLSELIGILLGDGGIFYDKVKHRYLFSVTLNGVDEEIYLIYVIDLIIKIFNKQPAEHWERDKPSAKDDAKGVALIVYGEEIVRQLLKLGLKSGNKVKNQVGVPICIFSSEEFSIRCLKGLFDTDGSIYLNKSRKSIYLSFSNSSINLVEGFCKLCDKIGIVSNFYGPYYRKNKKTGKVTRSYSALILQKEEVKNFLKIVNPEKWRDENRREFIGILIILLKNPTMFNKLIKEHQLKYPTEEFKFSIQNLRFLKDFCKGLKLEISKSLINTEIEESFEFKYLNYSIEFAEYLKDLSIEKGSIREVVKAIDKKYRVTSKDYIKRLFYEPEYMELYGNQGYSRWVNHNFEVLIDDYYDSALNKRVIRVRRFSFDIKKEICLLIFNALKSSVNKKLNEEIVKDLTLLFNKIDLNNKLIENSLPDPKEISRIKPKILLFERLAFLLNNSEYKGVIHSHISILIKFIREILRIIDSNEKYDLEDLKKHFRNRLKINWRSKNIKKILLALNVFNKIIIEKNQSQLSPILSNLEEANNQVKANLKNSKSKKNIDNKEKLSYNRIKANVIDEDFTDPYLWFSPQVRESIRSKVESLIDEVHEDINTINDFSDTWGDLSFHDESNLETEPLKEISDNPIDDIIQERDIEVNPEVSEIQEDNKQERDIDANPEVPENQRRLDEREPEIISSGEKIEDQTIDQQGSIEDQPVNPEHVEDNEKINEDIKPDAIDQEEVDSPTLKESESVPEPSGDSQESVEPTQEGEKNLPIDPQNQQEQDDTAQIPENLDESNNKELDSENAEPIDETLNRDQPISDVETLADKPETVPEEIDNTNQDEEQDSTNIDEGEGEPNKEENQEVEDKEESKDDPDRDKQDDLEELPEEFKDETKEEEQEPDIEPQEEEYDDVDNVSDNSVIEITPEDLIGIMMDYIGQQVYPEYYGFQSINLDSINGDIIIMDESDFRETWDDMIIGGDFQEDDPTEVPTLDEKIPDELSDDEMEEGKFDEDLEGFL